MNKEYKEMPFNFEIGKEVYSFGMKYDCKIIDTIGASHNPKAVILAKPNNDIVIVSGPKFYQRKDEDGKIEHGIEWNQGYYLDSGDVSYEIISDYFLQYGYYKVDCKDIVNGEYRQDSIENDQYSLLLTKVKDNNKNYSDTLVEIVNSKYNTLKDLTDALVEYGYGEPGCEFEEFEVMREPYYFKVKDSTVDNCLKESFAQREKLFEVAPDFSKEEVIYPSVSFEDVVNRALANKDYITSKDVWDACDGIIHEFTQALIEEVKYSMKSIVADANKKVNKVNIKVQ